MIKILLIEDQLVLRDSLSRLLSSQNDMQVVAESGKAAEAYELCQTYKPNLVLMDVITESSESGISAASKLRKDFPELKIIIMTGMPEITFIEKAKEAKVDSFIYKNVKSDMLLSSIRSTAEGYGTFPQKSKTNLPDGLSFTDEEIQVLRLVCAAKSRKEIAAELFVSESSIKAIITGILNKTGYDSIMKFAIYAIANGYIAPNL